MKFKYIVAYESNSDKFDNGQGHCRPSKVFVIYPNTNCQVLQVPYLSFGTS